MSANSIGWAGKENEISVGIEYDEGSGAPRFFLQGLTEVHSCGLVTQEKPFDFVCGSNGERGSEQALALANIAGEHGFAHHPQIQARLVAGDLPVEWRIAMDEGDREAELASVEIAGCFDVGNEQLCLG